jgi:hypothetical protein
MATNEQIEGLTDEVAELRALIAQYELEALRREQSALIDICIARGDLQTAETIRAHLAESIATFERWGERE